MIPKALYDFMPKAEFLKLVHLLCKLPYESSDSIVSMTHKLVTLHQLSIQERCLFAEFEGSFYLVWADFSISQLGLKLG